MDKMIPLTAGENKSDPKQTADLGLLRFFERETVEFLDDETIEILIDDKIATGG